jgi:hypothetical protein
MTTAVLQFEHHLGETFVRYLILLLLFPRLRDLIVLAIDAPKIAVSEEDVPGTLCTRKARFLAKVCGE